MAIARSVDRRLFFLLDRSHALLGKRADKKLRESAGLGRAQAAVLTYLGYNDGCRLTELAHGVGHNNSAITALCERMDTAGLIIRRKVLFDGRGRTVHLTEKGWERRVIVMDVMRDFNTAIRKGFSEAEMDVILRFLNATDETLSSERSA